MMRVIRERSVCEINKRSHEIGSQFKVQLAVPLYIKQSSNRCRATLGVIVFDINWHVVGERAR